MVDQASRAGRGGAGGIVVHVPAFEQAAVMAALAAAFPDRAVTAWPEAPAGAEALVCFRPPPGAFARLPSLRLVHASGAGVDHILAAPDLPPGLPVLRVVDAGPVMAMTRHVVHAALHIAGRHAEYAAAQRAGQWRRLRPEPLPRVAVLGLGAMGAAAARALAGLGFAVTGWSRAPRAIEDVACQAGAAALDGVLDGAGLLVVLLPMTPATRGLIGAREMARLAAGAGLVAAGRGGQVVEADLLAALDQGRVGAAHLDVFGTEPLPPGHPFWSHPRVTLTPHIASPPDAAALARSLAAAFAALEAGAPLAGIADRQAGY
jgi:glyoxylate/hydroxypyruvate reductase A